MNHSTEFQSLPRINIYFADGRGRDSYIYANNGGNWKTSINRGLNTIDNSPSSSSSNHKLYNLR